MDQAPLVKRIEELRQQCRFGRLAWQGLRQSLNGMDNEKAFFYVHALVERARMVSRFLWSEGAESAERSKAAREALKVGDESPLNAVELRQFADSGEAQFDRWLSSLDHLHYVGMNIMPQGTVSDFRQDSFLRSLDPELYQFTWYDRSLDLRKIALALRDLETMADSWLKRV